MKAYYYEDNAKVLVEVLSDEVGEDNMRRVSLKCIESIKPHFAGGHMKEGFIFDVCQHTSVYGICWGLEPVEEDAA